MIEEEGDPRLKPRPEAENYGETLLYDYSKFLTTVSLLALGGILTLSQTDELADVKPFRLALAIGSIVVGGVFALSVSNGIVIARSAGKEPSRWLRLSMRVALAGIALGLGVFINIFWQAVT
jgi:hypothetical protein